MFITLTPVPYTKGAPGAMSWWSTSPESTSALHTMTVAAIDAGAVVPAPGAGARTSGMASSAHVMSLSSAS